MKQQYITREELNRDLLFVATIIFVVMGISHLVIYLEVHKQDKLSTPQIECHNETYLIPNCINGHAYEILPNMICSENKDVCCNIETKQVCLEGAT